MLKKRKSLVSSLSHVPRVILGAVLLLGILWSNIPSSAITTGPMCTLACCAGRAPHAAGSCMNGSCHAFLKGRVKTSHIHRQLPVQQSKQLCGLSKRLARTTARPLKESSTFAIGDSSEQSGVQRSPEVTSVSTATIGKPCHADCGAGTFSSSSQSRPRDSGATSYADKPRPPSTAQHEHSLFSHATALQALCSRARPRGPPISSS